LHGSQSRAEIVPTTIDGLKGSQQIFEGMKRDIRRVDQAHQPGIVGDAKLDWETQVRLIVSTIESPA
jgi:hypothetical protein